VQQNFAAFIVPENVCISKADQEAMTCNPGMVAQKERE
jgi:hypothetical protein